MTTNCGFEFNMRRKAEILQYKNNNNKNITQKQQYANQQKKGKQLFCEITNEYTPLSNSGVKGSTGEYLYYNPDIPLVHKSVSFPNNVPNVITYTIDLSSTCL